jgi:single-strand DNA-binding protein
MVNISIIGRLGADAEIVESKNGRFVKFRIAVDDRKNGEKTTTWFGATFNGDRALKVAEYLTKGKLLSVMGTENVGLFTAKDGSTQVSREISVQSLEFISVSSGSTSSDSSTEITTGKLTEKEKKPATVTAAPTSTEDDLPF